MKTFRAYMSPKEIKDMYAAGYSSFEVLAEVIGSGVKFPEAVSRVSAALRLDKESVAEMVDGYDNNC